MRKSLLDPLLPRIRAGILAATFLNPDRWSSLAELARDLGRTPSSLQRELARLTQAEFLQLRREAGRVFYRAHPDLPIRRELTAILERSIGATHVLQAALAPWKGKIRVAFLYGSMARGTAGPQSDMDILVVGLASLSEIAPVVRRVEERLARQVQIVIYDPDEFSHKAVRDHFVRAVLSREREYLIGGERDLEALVGRRTRRAAQDKPRGNRGPTKGRRPKPS